MAEMPIWAYALPIPDGERLLLAYLWRRVDGCNGLFASVRRATLARTLGVDPSTLRRRFRHLRRHGLVANAYRIIDGALYEGWELTDCAPAPAGTVEAHPPALAVVADDGERGGVRTERPCRR